MKKVSLLFSALLISMSSMAQMLLWQGGQSAAANLDSITFSAKAKPDNNFTIVESTLLMYTGTTYALTLEDNLYPSSQYSWASGNTRVAFVDANGTITAKRPGMTIITATYGTRTQMCILTVETKVISLSTEKEIKMYVDSTYQIKATVKPATAVITWESSDVSVATVDETGLVTAHSDGTCQVYAVAGHQRRTTEVSVFNNPVTVELKMGDIAQKKVTVHATPSDNEGYYYCGFAPKSTFKDMSDTELIETLFSNLMAQYEQYKSYGYTLDKFLKQGEQDLTASGLTASTDYEMFAFGVDVQNEKPSPIITRVDFRTADVVKSNMTITIQQDSVVYKENKKGEIDTLLYFSAHPSNDKEYYLFNGTTKETLTSKYDGDAKKFMEYLEAYYEKQGVLEKALRQGVAPICAKNPADGSTWVMVAAGYEGGLTTEVFTAEYTYNAPKDGMPARLVRKATTEDTADDLNAIQMLPLEDMKTEGAKMPTSTMELLRL